MGNESENYYSCPKYAVPLTFISYRLSKYVKYSSVLSNLIDGFLGFWGRWLRIWPWILKIPHGGSNMADGKFGKSTNSIFLAETTYMAVLSVADYESSLAFSDFKMADLIIMADRNLEKFKNLTFLSKIPYQPVSLRPGHLPVVTVVTDSTTDYNYRYKRYLVWYSDPAKSLDAISVDNDRTFSRFNQLSF